MGVLRILWFLFDTVRLYSKLVHLGRRLACFSLGVRHRRLTADSGQILPERLNLPSKLENRRVSARLTAETGSRGKTTCTVIRLYALAALAEGANGPGQLSVSQSIKGFCS